MTARAIIIHDPSPTSSSDDVAIDAINSEINDKVVVRDIGRSGRRVSGCRVSGCRVSGCRVSGCRVPRVPGYGKFSKCGKQDITENRTRMKAGIRGQQVGGTRTTAGV